MIEAKHVYALTIKNVGVGNVGEESSKCNSGYCGNTIGLNINNVNFKDTAIYGIRVSLVNNSGNVVNNKVANFWANSNMVKVIGNIKNENSYANFEYTANNNKLFNYKSGGLRDIDSSGITFADFINDMDVVDVSYVMEKLGVGLDEAINNNYLLKIEPIYVLHFYLGGNNYYFQGNSKEILELTYDKNNYKSDSDYDYATLITVLNFSNNNWNVIRNYLLTVYLNSAYEKLPYYKGNPVKVSTLDLYSDVRSGSSGLSAGYIKVSDFKNKFSSIVITKKTGDINKSDYAGQGCFQLLRYNYSSKKYDIYTNDGHTYHCNPYNPDSKNDKIKNQQVAFNNIPEGQYKIREVMISDDVDSVYFRQRTDTVGDYSIPMDDSNQFIYYLNSDYKKVIDSYYFEVKGGKKLFFRVYNHFDDTDDNPDDGKGTINIYKYFKKDGESKISQVGIAKFELYKRDEYGNYIFVEQRTKDKNKTRVSFTNLDPGIYKIIEYDVFNYFKVSILKSTNNVSSPKSEVEVNNYQVILDEAVEIGSGDYINYSITNISKGDDLVDTCDTKLTKLKENLCSGSNICPYKFYEEMLNLYDEYYEDDFNKLFNLKLMDNNTFDISGVACENYTFCKDELSSDDGSSSNNNKLFCNNGEFESSKPSDENIQKRVCYVGDILQKRKTYGSFYNDDLGAYCSISFNYKTNFEDETLTDKSILWKRNSSNIGNLSFNVLCEGVYDSSQSQIANRELDVNKYIIQYLPSYLISWSSFNGKNMDNDSQNLILIENESQFFTSKSFDCDESGYCYGTWTGTYVFDIKYTDKFKSYNDSGVLNKNPRYNSTYDNTIFYGLPINVNDKNGEKSAILNISFNYNGTSVNKSVQCPYEISNKDPDPDPKNYQHDFRFRIIDINNPFPGINGLGRLVGDNWCLDSYIGSLKYNDLLGNKQYVVGDLNEDSVVSKNELDGIDFSKLNYKDNISADVDLDGKVTYSENCGESTDTDNCILKRYLDNGNERKYNCKSSNYLVDKYIKNSSSSNSDDKPMYSFTITASDIKNIRAYNKLHSYDEFNLKCSYGKYCISEFLTDWIKNGQINGKSVSVRLNADNSWCYNNRVSGSNSLKDIWCDNNK